MCKYLLLSSLCFNWVFLGVFALKFDRREGVCYNPAMSKNIVLVGFMGAGKSAVAKNLAMALKRKVVSTDALIEKKEKRPIAAIFKDSGEPYFRSVEKSVVEEVAQESNLIIDCGGGVVLNQNNIDNLKKNGKIFYLSATADVIYERVKNEKHRPLLDVADPKARIKELLKQRKSRYEQADYTLDTSRKAVDEVARKILKLMPHD